MSLSRFLAAAVFAAAGATTPSAFAHAKLQSSDPAAGSTLYKAPKQVRLKFNEALEPAFSGISLLGPANQAIPVAGTAVDKTDPAVLTAQLPPLANGSYRLRWSVMTHDGHKTKGEVGFTVK